MKINSDFISDVKSKLDIVDVIGAYINLQKAGINYKGICPFHNDSHPSMMVNKARQTYHCFVCGEHGDVLDFLQKYNQITFNEALRIACKLADVEFPEQESTPEENAAYKLLESRRIAIAAAAKFRAISRKRRASLKNAVTSIRIRCLRNMELAMLRMAMWR